MEEACCAEDFLEEVCAGFLEDLYGVTFGVRPRISVSHLERKRSDLEWEFIPVAQVHPSRGQWHACIELPVAEAVRVAVPECGERYAGEQEEGGEEAPDEGQGDVSSRG